VVLQCDCGVYKETDNLCRRYGQSYEMFFLDEADYLDYQRLVNEVDAAKASPYNRALCSK